MTPLRETGDALIVLTIKQGFAAYTGAMMLNDDPCH